MSWFLTHCGRQFFPGKVEESHVCIEDIAHALSNICRFGGHTREFYSVAQHSVIVSQNVPKEFAFLALMHDATEAYVGDMINPIKALFPDFKQLEQRVWRRIAGEFRLPKYNPTHHIEIENADRRALMTERRDLMDTTKGDWSWGIFDDYEPFESRIYPLWPERAKALFMDRFNEVKAWL